MKRFAIALFMSAVLSAACTKDAEIKERDYPLVRTFLSSTNESITFTGEIFSEGRQEITGYGFVYDTLYGKKYDTIHFSGKPADKFNITLQAGFATGKLYQMRAFIRTREEFIFGNKLEFVFNGSKPVELYSFSPSRGTTGDTVIIEGKYFSRAIGGNIVKFGNDTAKVIVVQENRIYVKVPEIPVEQISKVSVKTPTAYGEFGQPFERWYCWSRIYEDLPEHYHRGTKVDDLFIMFDFRTGSTLVFNVLTGSYFNAAKFPGPGTAYVFPSFSCGGKAYFMFTQSDYYAKELWQYDPYSDEWTQKQDLPQEMNSSIRPFVIGSKAYIHFTSSSFWEYDTDLDKWTIKTPPQSYPAFSFSAGGKGYLGFSGDKIRVFEYNPAADSWTYKSDYPGLGSRDLIGFFINGKIYIGLGQYDYNFTYLCNDMWEFNTENGVWKRTYDFPDSGHADGYRLEIYSEDGYAIRHYGHSYVMDVYKFNPERR